MKQAVIFGAGNIGRGFIGQLFGESGYFVTFVDVDRPLLDALNARGSYTIRLTGRDGMREVTAGPVRALHASDHEAVAAVLAEADLAATAVGAAALPAVASNLAAGIARRAALAPDAGGALNVIVCENLKGAAGILRSLVNEALPESCRPFLAERVGFVDTVIARMVPAPTPEMRAKDPSLIMVEPYAELPVDRAGFSGPIPAIVGMIPHTPFAFYTDRKLYVHNAGHAVLAYLGYRSRYRYGYEALADEDIYFQVRGAMEESGRALVRRYGPAGGGLLANIDDLLQRFGNRGLGDTILRLARDPVRKLAAGDRLVGAAVNALAQGVQPTNLVAGIAAGLRFDSAEDPVAVALQARLQRDGLERVLAEVCGLAPGEPLAGMVTESFAAIAETQVQGGGR